MILKRDLLYEITSNKNLMCSNASLRKSPSNIIAVNLSLSDLLYCLQWPSVIYCCLTQSTWILEKIPFGEHPFHFTKTMFML